MNRSWNIGRYKAIDLSLYVFPLSIYTGIGFDFSVKVKTAGDHAPMICLMIVLLWIHFDLTFYDSRHAGDHDAEPCNFNNQAE